MNTLELTNLIPVLPRKSLREKHFRRFEKYLARACYGTVVVNLSEMEGRKMNAKTFITNLLEARLGYTKYGYKSDLIPADYDLTKIKSFETEDGKVLLRNDKADEAKVEVMSFKNESTPMPTSGFWEFNSDEEAKFNHLKQLTIEQVRAFDQIKVILHTPALFDYMVKLADRIGVVSEETKLTYVWNPTRRFFIIKTQE